MPNRLATATSAYLKSAAHQPVEWYAWGPEAFARARTEDKPILLDIGAVWCHWCHVIDRESYENPEIAAIINEHFIAVKVDRDERPDIDIRYQNAVSAISGQGGWPLTAALTPEGKVFFGGTYFPPENAMGRPGFKQVLRAVAEFYRTKRDQAQGYAQELFQSLQRLGAARGSDEMLAPQLIDEAVVDIERQFDMRNGGFGGAPKFPHTGALELLPDRLANLAILPLQLRLVYEVGQRYGQQLDANQIKDLAGTFGLGAAAQMVEGLVRKVLGGAASNILGGLLGGGTGIAAGAAVTFAATYALGHAAKQYYAQGRKLSADDLRALFNRFQDEAKGLLPQVQGQIQSLAGQVKLPEVLSQIRSGAF